MNAYTRAREIGTGLDSKDMSNFNVSVIGLPNPDSEFYGFCAFKNITASDYWVAIINELNKHSMELAIYPIMAKTDLIQQGIMAYNIGTTLSDAIGTLSTATYSWTSSPAASSMHVISIYATEAFYLKTLTNCTIINNPGALNSVVGLPAGTHTLLVKATNNAATSILFDKVGGGTPSGLSVAAYVVTAWSKNQCRGII